MKKNILFYKMAETTPLISGESIPVIPADHAEDIQSVVMSAFGIFTIVVIIVLIGITALFATNAVFFDKIRDGSCAKISKNEAEALYWTNVVLAVIAGLLALAAIIMLFVFWRKPDYKKKYLGRFGYTQGTSVAAGRKRFEETRGRYLGAFQAGREVLRTGPPTPVVV